ncbi:unnamed protein product [Aureobasidium uvarum]|uniref:Uncharacterized protein n=1 Tax=Aureobasidium uvarum TaxID=2773716 RepID=A0A9N8KCJ5_9PEZI|nr:unnamed protein product [Aureobasidium uvarum]
MANQQPEDATKPEPTAKVRGLKERRRAPSFFMSPTATWNLYRHNPWYLSWQQETWAMIFSVACLVAVAVIMAWIDGKRLSIWHWAIQPNAVISVLIVSSKAALMISTASCVSQLKWTHFQQQPRKLKDLEGFDDASRGAYGSLCLLMSKSGYLNVAVTLGCAVTVLVLAMETFGQQLLSFPEKRIAVSNETASFPVIQDMLQMPYWGDNARLSDRMLQSRLGLMESIYGKTTASPFDCPASSCSWDSHVTLGLCSSCRDIATTESACRYKISSHFDGWATYNSTFLECDYAASGEFHSEGGGGNLTTIRRKKADEVLYPGLPDVNNASAWEYNTAINIITWFNEGFWYKGQPAIALNFSVIVTNDTWEQPQITTCTLQFCAWVYENSTAQGQDFDDGKLEKYPLGYESIQLHQSGHGMPLSYSYTNYTFRANGTGFPSDKHNDTFKVYGDAYTELSSHLGTILDSSTYDYSAGSNASSAGLGSALIMNSNITELGDRMAISLTNVWRQYQNIPAIGTAWESVAFIHVEWAWLALPAMAVMSAGIVLLMTTLQNRRTVLWKSSVLPYSFRVLHGWDDTEFDSETLEEIRERAKEMTGQLVGDEKERVRLVKSCD